MKRLVFCIALLAIAPVAYAEIHQELHVSLRPTEHRLQTEVVIDLPTTQIPASGFQFRLHAGLNPTSITPGVLIVSRGELPPVGDLRTEEFNVILPTGVSRFVLRYEGEIFHPLKSPDQDYGRGFSETPGLITDEGVYLSSSSYWYPQFNLPDLMTFTIEATVPSGWDTVSQGNRSTSSRAWNSSEPQDEIYLIAAPFTVYSKESNGISIQAFLRTPDEALAKKYMDVTGQYIEMYGQLIGTYPYKKFALVENFWETGYGMPSFTLLGSKIIRFPFIINSSYPHEVLHNWWGNGVYVDYATGNWCEGLTAYLADHLIREQSGGGVEYRRSTLQRYTDFVSGHNDFPLKEFTGRHDAATEAVGYGKSLMFFHMLRMEFGDEKFIQGLRAFYGANRFRLASFSDIQAAMGGLNLGKQFTQWVERIGAPELKLSDVRAVPEGSGFRLLAKMEQLQTGDAYHLIVPVAVHVEGESNAVQTQVAMEAKTLELNFLFPKRPSLLEVDPEFDLFRRVAREEIPAALSQAYGSKKVLVVLPSSAAETERQAYRALADLLKQAETEEFEIRLDSDLSELPADRTVWLLGWDSTLKSKLIPNLKKLNVSLTERAVVFESGTIARRGHTFVFTLRNAADPSHAVVWVSADPSASEVLTALGGKLPHYSKYSYLVFEGPGLTSIAKGQWPVPDSPLSVVVKQMDGSAIPVKRGKLAPRKALIMPSLREKN